MNTLHARVVYFYPRPPRGGRPHIERQIAGVVGFLSTPSARRATSGLSRYGYR